MDESILSRQMPHSAKAEQAVLGSVLSDPSCVSVVMEQLKARDFYLQMNRNIFEVLYSMFNLAQPIDPIVALDHLSRQEGLDRETLANYMGQIIDITPTSSNVREYIKIIKDKYILRMLGEVAGDVLEKIHSETGDELLELTEQRIFALRQGKTLRGLVPIDQVLLEVYDRLAQLAERDSAIPGLSTGLGELDSSISGLNKSDLILLAARPGMGKTAMALNILLHAGKFSGKKVAFFSLEMSRDQLGLRLIATESFVDNKKLTTGKLSDKEWDQIVAASEALKQTGIYIDDDSSATVSDIKARCRRLDNLGLIVVDYLQLMQTPPTRGGGENRQQAVSEMSRGLKIMAKELDVPVLCLSQLSRASEKRENKRPMLSDLRESGAIEQDADIVLFLFRDDYYDQDAENHNIAECIVAKNRHGERATVELQWIPQFTTFTSLDRRHSPPG